MNWDITKTNTTILFCNLKKNKEYILRMDNWYNDLDEQYAMSKRNVNLLGVVINDWNTKGGIIPKGTKIKLSLWRAFFDKWSDCLNKDNLKPTDIISITLLKTSTRIWYITSIKKVR